MICVLLTFPAATRHSKEHKSTAPKQPHLHSFVTQLSWLAPFWGINAVYEALYKRTILRSSEQVFEPKLPARWALRDLTIFAINTSLCLKTGCRVETFRWLMGMTKTLVTHDWDTWIQVKQQLAVCSLVHSPWLSAPLVSVTGVSTHIPLFGTRSIVVRPHAVIVTNWLLQIFMIYHGQPRTFTVVCSLW